MRILKLVAATALVVFTAFSALAEETERYAKQKVVYHINEAGGTDSKGYKGAMGNIRNHINAVGAENMEIQIVMHGDGVGLLMAAKDDSTLQTIIGSLKSQKVGFQVCNNTLQGRNISYNDDLYDVWDDDIVPSGVAELSRLQQMGYTYIKP
jgi:intracellular sulfur oxidation DsrE/DsrF family protein